MYIMDDGIVAGECAPKRNGAANRPDRRAEASGRRASFLDPDSADGAAYACICAECVMIERFEE